ncbi:glycosyltransferase [Paeniroseomonas aquatica]|uniref:glycosyltransferase n=1 Tax=Paeniroseomonas aquatica TaxID=373043 RepID=UPI00360B20D7
MAAHTLFTGLREIGVDAIFIAACPEQDRARLHLGSAHERAVHVDAGGYDPFYHLAAPDVVAQLGRIVVADGIRLANFHHFLNFGVNALRVLEVPVVLTLHEFLAACHHSGQMVTRPARHLCGAATPEACATCFPERGAARFAMRQRHLLETLGGLRGFVSPSHFLADRMAGWGLPRSRIAVVENGLRDASPPAPAKAPGDDQWVFGFFGQINPFKGVDLLLEAATLIEADAALAGRVRIRIHGVMIGQPPEFVARFQAAVARHACLEFVGAYDNASVGRLMRDCDYVVVPSTWWENSPMVIQEAFQAGRPVLCSDIGGMAEKVVDGVSGLHFRIGNRLDLLRAMRTAMQPGVQAGLCAGLPVVNDRVAMARAYLEAFAGFAASPPASAVPSRP